MSDTIIQIKDVNKWFGDFQVLKNINLNVEKNKKIVVCGPSGSGKSTMLGLLGLLDVPSKGNVKVKGTDATSMNDFQRSRLRGDAIGFVFQQFHLIPHLSALGNVETALLYRGLSSKERKKRATDSLEKVGLGGREDHRPVQLSGGEQQRVAIARAIVTDPLVVLADEPTGALDSENAEKIMNIFAELKSPERAVCLVTHDMEIADSTERKISMKDGEIVQDLIQGNKK